jgi:hypothetical protein
MKIKFLLISLTVILLTTLSFAEKEEKGKWIAGFLNEFGKDYIIVNEDRYLIDENTAVKDISGKNIILNDIKEPVEVEILVTDLKVKEIIVKPKPIKR